jgi:hypothetical protein
MKYYLDTETKIAHIVNNDIKLTICDLSTSENEVLFKSISEFDTKKEGYNKCRKCSIRKRKITDSDEHSVSFPAGVEIYEFEKPKNLYECSFANYSHGRKETGVIQVRSCDEDTAKYVASDILYKSLNATAGSICVLSSNWIGRVD